ncbi:MAG: hypothetical protein GY796_33685 [Chloroflexi bacterium]|nr:hypothetical protein [Chloroflexota bacterium]
MLPPVGCCVVLWDADFRRDTQIKPKNRTKICVHLRTKSLVVVLPHGDLLPDSFSNVSGIERGLGGWDRFARIFKILYDPQAPVVGLLSEKPRAGKICTLVSSPNPHKAELKRALASKFLYK